MGKAFVYLLLFIWMGCGMVFSQGISGRVSEGGGAPVPYATVYVQALHRGTIANELGEYQLALPGGRHEVRFQYLGYKTVTMFVDVDMDDIWQTINVVFEEQQYRLPEVVVTASGEDPAYYIMRRAIGMSQYYLSQVSAYTCQVYLKGTGVITRMPALMRRQMEREGVEEGKYFVTETLSKISFELPDRYKTEVISLRSSGNDSQSSPMAFVTVSLYRDINGIISPLSRDALRVYRFVLEGSFIENGEHINKIRVEPRRPGPDLYSGTIFIREEGWNLHSVDLKVSQSLFDIGIRQVYNPVAEGVWMPVSHNFDITLSLMSFDMAFSYLASVSDYEVSMNPALDHGFYLGGMGFVPGSETLRSVSGNVPVQAELAATLQHRTHSDSTSMRQQQIQGMMANDGMSNRDMRRINRLIRQEARDARPRESLELMPDNTVIADSARLRSRQYWDANRPVLLTDEELESFDEAAADTTETDDKKKAGKQVIRKLIMGSNYTLTDRWSLVHGGLPGMSSYDYNTVDGFLASQKLSLNHSHPEGRRLSISNQTAYAFSRKKVLTDTELSYLYSPFKRASIKVSGGTTTADFHADNGIPRMFNMVTSLYFKQNFLKLYGRNYVHVQHQFDLANGLVLHTGAEYAKRKRLANQSNFSFANPYKREYSPNLPFYSGLPLSSTDDHIAMILDAKISYTPRHYYRLIGRQKQMMYSKYPTVSLYYKQGLAGWWDSDTHFSQLEASVNQAFSFRLIGQFSYRLLAGRFFDADEMYFADYKHFNTSPLWFKADNSIGMFRSLPYYSYSTADGYGVGHVQYDHSRILLKRLPFLADKLIREKIFFNGLITPHQPAYLEFGYGLDQLWLVFSLELVSGFSGGRHQYTGFRIGIPLSNAISVSL